MKLEERCNKVISQIKRFGKTAMLAGALLGYTACSSETNTESRKETYPSSAQTEQTMPEFARDTIRGIPLSVSKHPTTQSSYYKNLDAGAIAIGLYTEDRGLLLAKDKALIRSTNRFQTLPRPHDHTALEYVAIEALINAEMKLDPNVEIMLVGRDAKGAFFFDEVILPSYTIKLYDRQTQRQYIKKNTK